MSNDVVWCENNIREEDVLIIKEPLSQELQLAVASLCNHSIVSSGELSFWTAFIKPNGISIQPKGMWSKFGKVVQDPCNDIERGKIMNTNLTDCVLPPPRTWFREFPSSYMNAVIRQKHLYIAVDSTPLPKWISTEVHEPIDFCNTTGFLTIQGKVFCYCQKECFICHISITLI